MFSKKRFMKLAGIIKEKVEVPTYNTIPPEDQDNFYEKIYDKGWSDFTKKLNPKYKIDKNDEIVDTTTVKPISYEIKDLAIAYIDGYNDAKKYYKS